MSKLVVSNSGEFTKHHLKSTGYATSITNNKLEIVKMRTFNPANSIISSQLISTNSNDPRCQQVSIENGGGINSLPNELMLHIFSYLNTKELLQCASICERWRHVSSDWYVWHQRLQRALRHYWSTIVYPGSVKMPSLAASMLLSQVPVDLAAGHPRDVYVHLVRFVPSQQRRREYEQNAMASTSRWSVHSEFLTNSDVKNDKEVIDENAENVEFVTENSTNSNFRQLIYNWWDVLTRSLPNQLNNTLTTALRNGCGANSHAANRLTQKYIPKIAVFGPGFDKRATSHLFRKMVDTRTRSFEPINMFPGRYGFGSGLTMKLFADAQLAATQFDKNCSSDCLLGAEATSDNSLENANDDYTFDIIHLYSLSGHLNHNFENQFSRICMSRLFDTLPNELPEQEVLDKLEVTDNMRCLCTELDALIYTIDARESDDQLAYLETELTTVKRGFPKYIADKVPILILYIMPKDDIIVNPSLVNHSPALVNIVNDQVETNRDSYKGTKFTQSWPGSLLTPIIKLQLFKLPNPWRLQKCASNDMLSLIRGIIWLKLQLSNEFLHHLRSRQ